MIKLESWQSTANGDTVLLHAEGFPFGGAQTCKDILTKMVLPSSFWYRQQAFKRAFANILDRDLATQHAPFH